jgi:hypothetical protein
MAKDARPQAPTQEEAKLSKDETRDSPPQPADERSTGSDPLSGLLRRRSLAES